MAPVAPRGPHITTEEAVVAPRHGRHHLHRHEKAFELAVLPIRLYRSLDAVAGGDLTVMRRWLRAPNTALGGIPPERLFTVTGLVDVIAHLDSRRAVL